MIPDIMLRTCLERDGPTIVIVKIDGTFDKTGLPDPLLMGTVKMRTRFRLPFTSATDSPVLANRKLATARRAIDRYGAHILC